MLMSELKLFLCICFRFLSTSSYLLNGEIPVIGIFRFTKPDIF